MTPGPTRAVRNFTRRRGSDLTNSLLWSAFAILIILSVLVLVRIVNMNQTRMEMIQGVNLIVSEARTLHLRKSSYQGLTANTLIRSGALPPKMVKDLNGQGRFFQLVLPKGGYVSLNPGAFSARDPNAFEMILYFGNDRDSQSLCHYMSGGREDFTEYSNSINYDNLIETGPLGTNYVMNQIMCQRDGFKLIRLHYVR